MKKPNILVIDGQGGKIGSAMLDALKTSLAAGGIDAELTAVGTNSIATANMLKSSPDAAATGENPVVVNCRYADYITGPVGIVIADSLNGEVTAKMAAAVGESTAMRVLIPVNRCRSMIAGVGSQTLAALIRDAVRIIISDLANNT